MSWAWSSPTKSSCRSPSNRQMSARPRRITVLGAPGTGAAELAGQLRTVLLSHPEIQLLEAPSLATEQDLALLMGLDQPTAQAAARQAQEQHDLQLRQQLHARGLPYRVVYGLGSVRLSNALLALGLPPADAEMQQTREAAQFDLNRGLTHWSCEKCSDPACEHRLFTGLLERA